MADLSGLFRPDRVAVVGATDRPGSIGRAVVANLRTGFTGEVVAVNPHHDSVLGVPCVPSLEAAGDVDLAVVVVPADAAVAVVEQAGRAGVEHVVVITAGFSEAGEAGVERERELQRLADVYDLTLVGPNCLGILGSSVGLNATFSPSNALPGSLSFLSQSGAVVAAVLDWAGDRGIGFKDVVSLGNKAVLDEVDFIEAWDDDPGTHVILGYLESLDDGRAFIERVREVTATTPVVLIKAGRTEAGARAAASHTGAIAGSDRAAEAGFEQAGVLRATSLEELFDVARALDGQPIPDGDGVAIVSNAGGLAVLATDALVETPLELATFTDETVARLAAVLPEEGEPVNPLDVIGDADVGRFQSALGAALADPNVGAAVVLSAPSALLDFEEVAYAVANEQRAAGLPVVTCLLGGERTTAAERGLRGVGIPNYGDPARAVRGLGALARYRAVRDRGPRELAPLEVDRARAREVVAAARERGDAALGVEGLELLTAYGVPTAAGEVATSPAAAATVAANLGGPVVLKVVSPDVVHKTDVGGVEVGVPADEVADRYAALVDRVTDRAPGATVTGILVQEQVALDPGVETLLGATRDPQFGPMVAFGLGGIYVEVFADVALRVAPVTAGEARSMTEEITAAPMLRGARGQPPVDLDAVVEAIQRVARLAADVPAIRELDVNPLVATPDGVVAVDFRASLD